MSLVRLLRFLLPLQNPVGFGLSDFVELGLAIFFVGGLLLRQRGVPGVRYIAERPAFAMALLASAPIALRLLLVRDHPIPFPNVSDDFSYLLLGDTFAHFRLSNPAHPMRRFFESVFVLQEPSYASIFPPAQGFVLALGEVIFGLPWAGVAISIGAMCALVYWMLRAWTTPLWSLAGGLLAAMQFGPLNQWMNNFWGGAVSACAGCLVFGALPRLRARPRTRDAVLLGSGLGLQLLARPFESLLLDFCVLIYALFALRDRHARARLPDIAIGCLVPVICAGALTLMHNRAVTGRWTELPYRLSQYQYGIPASFTFEPMPVPHRPLTQEQQLDYEAQKEVHGPGAETLETFFRRYAGRVRFYKFFFEAPLYIALVFFLPSLRYWFYAWLALCGLIFSIGANIYPYFYQHYLAALTCVFVLIIIEGLRRLARLRIRGVDVGREAVALIFLLCGAQFLFWYGLHLAGNETLFIATGPYESWDYINYGDELGRLAVDGKLREAGGKQLVFVRYGARHTLQEWIHDDADIDSSAVVWALDLGPAENRKLIEYYKSRKVWLVEPDFRPPKLTPYSPERP